jgi:hypothetical protein
MHIILSKSKIYFELLNLYKSKKRKTVVEPTDGYKSHVQAYNLLILNVILWLEVKE